MRKHENRAKGLAVCLAQPVGLKGRRAGFWESWILNSDLSTMSLIRSVTEFSRSDYRGETERNSVNENFDRRRVEVRIWLGSIGYPALRPSALDWAR